MAVELEFINLIIRKTTIAEKVVDKSGSVADMLKLYWADEHLYCTGAMNPQDIESEVDYWKQQGLEPYKIVDGHRVWHDLCVVEGMFMAGVKVCDWLEISDRGWYARLIGDFDDRVACMNPNRKLSIPGFIWPASTGEYPY